MREASFNQSVSAADELNGETNGFGAGTAAGPAGETAPADPAADSADSAAEVPDVTETAETPEVAEAADITYDEQFYPARPKALRPIARRRQFFADRPSLEFDGRNAAYVEWLRSQAMLGDANVMARQLSGQASMWQNSYAHPNPRAAVERAPVWFTAYPLSFITRPGQSFLAALGDPELWDAFREIGIRGLHTGPVKLAGGIRGWSQTPSVDGHFDRITWRSTRCSAPRTNSGKMCEVAAATRGR